MDKKDQSKNTFDYIIIGTGPAGAVDIGGVVASLCTDEMGWVNGQRLEASGGQLL